MCECVVGTVRRHWSLCSVQSEGGYQSRIHRCHVAIVSRLGGVHGSWFYVPVDCRWCFLAKLTILVTNHSAWFAESLGTIHSRSHQMYNVHVVCSWFKLGSQQATSKFELPIFCMKHFCLSVCNPCISVVCSCENLFKFGYCAANMIAAQLTWDYATACRDQLFSHGQRIYARFHCSSPIRCVLSSVCCKCLGKKGVIDHRTFIVTPLPHETSSKALNAQLERAQVLKLLALVCRGSSGGFLKIGCLCSGKHCSNFIYHFIWGPKAHNLFCSCLKPIIYHLLPENLNDVVTMKVVFFMFFLWDRHYPKKLYLMAPNTYQQT